MKDNIANITRWVLFGLLFIAALAGILFYSGALGSEYGSGANNFINISKIFVYFSIIVLLVAPIYTMIKNPKNLMKMVVSVVALLVILAISYGIATNQLTTLQLETYHITAETSRLVGMGLYATYFVLGLSVVAIIYSAIVKIFK
ncbi:MAG: hypothetical protein JXR65_02770 [Bacteroidales bacterium]|nr:hypothetical protein [Bacteroidales bacterium]